MITPLELFSSSCRWPIGDPMKPRFGFCGEPSKEEFPYCENHCKIAYQPPKKRTHSNREIPEVIEK